MRYKVLPSVRMCKSPVTAILGRRPPVIFHVLKIRELPVIPMTFFVYRAVIVVRFRDNFTVNRG